MFKRGLSPIIATVLLIVLTLAAVSILSAFLIPFIRDGLNSSKSCVGGIGKINFDADSGYNCRFRGDTNKPARTGFSVNILSEEIKGFKVGLFSSGSSDVYEIKDFVSLAKIRMLNKDFNQALEVPESGETRTYVAQGDFDKIIIYPIFSDGSSCNTQEEIVIDECNLPDIISSLVEH